DPDGDLGLDVLEGLGSLLDKSLIQQEGTAEGEPRFAMLETLREYALERLEASDEADTAHARHLVHFLAVDEAADSKLRGPEDAPWFRRLNTEHPNLRAALG